MLSTSDPHTSDSGPKQIRRGQRAASTGIGAPLQPDLGEPGKGDFVGSTTCEYSQLFCPLQIHTLVTPDPNGAGEVRGQYLQV